ncbi:hypothetical protein T11_1421 [Trichinella zimbabwensis]|uniref:Uncharacterized protein n=1 Tax=Trichinella zimbabwensis TaxID=268475 RepID=A0A0V1HX20_9BILA|nr:hypothetical protein T11_1421 [Trichinella zimbabwensis]
MIQRFRQYVDKYAFMKRATTLVVIFWFFLMYSTDFWIFESCKLCLKSIRYLSNEWPVKLALCPSEYIGKLLKVTSFKKKQGARNLEYDCDVQILKFTCIRSYRGI